MVPGYLSVELRPPQTAVGPIPATGSDDTAEQNSQPETENRHCRVGVRESKYLMRYNTPTTRERLCVICWYV